MKHPWKFILPYNVIICFVLLSLQATICTFLNQNLCPPYPYGTIYAEWSQGSQSDLMLLIHNSTVVKARKMTDQNVPDTNKCNNGISQKMKIQSQIKLGFEILNENIKLKVISLRVKTKLLSYRHKHFQGNRRNIHRYSTYTNSKKFANTLINSASRTQRLLSS